jgi:hypothetical protein
LEKSYHKIWEANLQWKILNTPIKLYRVLVMGCNAPPPCLPCHTYMALSLPSIKHFNHHRPLVVDKYFTCSIINKEFFFFVVVDRDFPCFTISLNYMFYYKHEQ